MQSIYPESLPVESGSSLSQLTLLQYGRELSKFGTRVVLGSFGTLWQELETYSMQRTPTFCVKPPDTAELRRLFWRERTPVVTYLIEPEKLKPANVFLYMCEDNGYDLSKLSKNARRDARLALRKLKISFVAEAELLGKGFAAFRDTRTRADLPDRTFEHFKRLCRYAYSYKGHLVVGAWKEEELAGFMVLVVIDDFVEIVASYSTNQDRGLCPNNALAHFVLDYFLTSKRCSTVSFGVSSLQSSSSRSGLHSFKTKVGFEARPVHRAFEFHPLLRPLINPLTLVGLKLSLKFNPGSRKLKKSVGVMEILAGRNDLAINDA
jgi:hypothetical protein